MTGIIIGIIAVLIFAIIYFILITKNIKLKQEIDNLQSKNLETLKVNDEVKAFNQQLEDRNKKLAQEKEEKESSIARLTDSISQLNQSYSTLENSFETAANQLSKRYQSLQENLEKEFQEFTTDLIQEYTANESSYKERLNNLLEDIKNSEQIQLSITEANIRIEEIKTQANFYKIQISKEDLEEIRILREILPKLRNKEALNKVIWKVYYENPTSDLIVLVIGSNAINGIYKITNLTNQMCYVGQAIDLAARWKQHIKRGLGAETPTKNKLYPAMQEFGVENFSFEVLEKCSKEQLNQQEDYWQNFFSAKTFGYSIK